MKREKRTLEELFDDPSLVGRLKDHLYSKVKLLGKERPFSEILQSMVDTMLEAEMDSFLREQQAQGTRNKRNGKTSKRVVSDLGMLEVSTPRDRNSDFEPELIGKRER